MGKPYMETAKTGDNRKETFVGHELINPEVRLKLILEKAEEPKTKLPTFVASSKKQESFRKHLLLLY